MPQIYAASLSFTTFRDRSSVPLEFQVRMVKRKKFMYRYIPSFPLKAIEMVLKESFLHNSGVERKYSAGTLGRVGEQDSLLILQELPLCLFSCYSGYTVL